METADLGSCRRGDRKKSNEGTTVNRENQKELCRLRVCGMAAGSHRGRRRGRNGERVVNIRKRTKKDLGPQTTRKLGG